MSTLKKGIDLENLDTAVNPRNDFYQYAAGGWRKAHPIPPEFPAFSVFTDIREKVRVQVRELIEGLGATPEAKEYDTLAQKISDLYGMGLDMETRNRLGASPILPGLKKIADITPKNLQDTLQELAFGITSPLFSTGASTDFADTDRYVMHIGEGALGLGDYEYYLVKNDTNSRILEAYKKYVKRVMRLAGYSEDEAERIWKNVIRIETEFARHTMKKEESRNPLNLHNMVSMEELQRKYPVVDWRKWFDSMGATEIQEVNVLSPGFLNFITRWLPTISIADLKDFLAFHAVTNATGVLSDEFYDADFELYERTMSGTEDKKPLWKRAMAIPESMFGEAVGQLYVDKYFPEANKEYMKGMVENLRKALAKHITALHWMGEKTKEKALEKLEKLTIKIGYPDKWESYEEIHIDPSKSYHDNVLEAGRWFIRRNIKRLKEPVDKTRWLMMPQTVNAYYSPSRNEICFPAGILQPPYFNFEADDALNYGAIGAVIGHEMTHGFDDSGRRFNASGNLENWWEKEDETRFEELTEGLVKQFEEVEAAPGVHCNGRFTLGENIADQGGLRVALTAYLDNCDDSASKDIDGFTPLQRFYLSYAQAWGTNIRPEEIEERVKNDPHSLPEHRVNVTLRNIAPFFEAFGIKEGDAMFRPEEERIIIW